MLSLLSSVVSPCGLLVVDSSNLFVLSSTISLVVLSTVVVSSSCSFVVELSFSTLLIFVLVFPVEEFELLLVTPLLVEVFPFDVFPLLLVESFTSGLLTSLSVDSLPVLPYVLSLLSVDVLPPDILPSLPFEISSFK